MLLRPMRTVLRDRVAVKVDAVDDATDAVAIVERSAVRSVVLSVVLNPARTAAQTVHRVSGAARPARGHMAARMTAVVDGTRCRRVTCRRSATC